MAIGDGSPSEIATSDRLYRVFPGWRRAQRALQLLQLLWLLQELNRALQGQFHRPFYRFRGREKAEATVNGDSVAQPVILLDHQMLDVTVGVVDAIL
ncbi:hypothetical protein D3C85_1633810 [compost metagenome]